MYLTKNLRQYDAGLAFVGFSPSKVSVPPRQDAWHMSGTCAPFFTQKWQHELNVFANMHHMHYQGKKQWTEQYRKGEFIGLIGEIQNYDFNSQKFVPISKTILPGDELVTHCVWDTTKKNVTTLGGESTSEEMCVNALIYYPAIPSLFVCWPAYTSGCDCDINEPCQTSPNCTTPVEYCGHHQDCGSCAADSRCGWCDAPSMKGCFHKAANSYSNATCISIGGKMNACNAPSVASSCADHSACGNCNADTENGCSWCQMSRYSTIASTCTNSTQVCEKTLGGIVQTSTDPAICPMLI